MNWIWNWNREASTDTKEIKKIIKDYYKQQYNKIDNLEEMSKFLERYKLFLRLNQDEIENRNRSITIVIMKLGFKYFKQTEV